MAVTVEYQAWAAGSYNWLDKTTATSAPLQINDKLDAWVAAVNANASNANKQITVRKDPTDSTSTNLIGWVIEAASSSNNSTFFTRLFTDSTTNLLVTFSSGWNNNGANGGYGATSGSAVTGTNNTWSVSGVLAEFSIATETANGQEFFCIGWRLNNSASQSDAFVLFKDSNGEWASLYQRSNLSYGSYYMPTHTTPQRNFNVSLVSLTLFNNAGSISELTLNSTNTTYLPATGNEFTATATAASPGLYCTTSTSEAGYGRWANLSGSRTAICLSNAPIWVVV